MSMRDLLSAYFEGAMELLYPSQANCLGCGDALGADNGWLCGECVDRLMPLARMSRERCRRCGRPVYAGRSCPTCENWSEDGVSFARYAHFYGRPVRKMITRMKYGGAYRLSAWMGVQLANAVAAENFDAPDVLVPVPMHRARLNERGFNHALYLANALSARVGVPVDGECLTRVRNTPQQARIARDRRGYNLAGAFRATNAVDGLYVLLVDDVLTSGETANGCARTLRAAGALGVQLITLAGPGGGYMG